MATYESTCSRWSRSKVFPSSAWGSGRLCVTIPLLLVFPFSCCPDGCRCWQIIDIRVKQLQEMHPEHLYFDSSFFSFLCPKTERVRR